MQAPNDTETNTGIIVGFSLGVALFLALARICPSRDDEEEDADDKAEELLDVGNKSDRSRVSLMARSAKASAPPFPLALTVAVIVDSGVDGLLIGLSSAAGASAGIVMAIALTIEMGFLALTYAAGLRKQPRCIAIPCIVAAPAVLAVGACVGAGAAAAVASNSALHTALISFGVAALLYLVTEELLLEAHEGQSEEHVWYIDFFFFFGFMAAFLLEKFSE